MVAKKLQISVNLQSEIQGWIGLFRELGEGWGCIYILPDIYNIK